MRRLLLFLFLLSFLGCKLEWGKGSSVDPVPSLDEFYMVIVENTSGQFLSGYAVEVCFPEKGTCCGSDGTTADYLTNDEGTVVIPCAYPPSEYNTVYVRQPGGTGSPVTIAIVPNPQWIAYGGYHKLEVIVNP